MKLFCLILIALFGLPVYGQISFMYAPGPPDAWEKPKDYSQTGTISADAKFIEADEIDNFQIGHAIIRKGEQFAVIDKNGGFVVPFNKYKFNTIGGFKIDTARCGYSGNFCVVRDIETEKFGFINYSGKLVIPCTLYDVRPFMRDGFAWAKEKDATGREIELFIDEKGKKYPIKHAPLLRHDILNLYAVSANGYTEYYHKTGRLILKTKRKVVGQFSEGLIRVDSTFELIGTKSGFMDTTGKMVIPYKFRTSDNYLGSFHSGLVLYQPLLIEDSKYIYLNRKGEAEIKLKSSDNIREYSFNTRGAGNFKGDATYLYINDQLTCLWKSKIAIVLPSYIQKNNPLFSSSYVDFEVFPSSLDMNFKEPLYMIFQARMTHLVSTKMTTGGFGTPKTITKQLKESFKGMGIANTVGEIEIAPLFEDIGYYNLYAQLSKATFRDVNTRTLISGYVNNKGIFTIVTSKKQY
jgi:hypothetical protein